MKYEKPVVHLTDTVSEGVYLASGAQETSGSQGGSQYRCKSKYIWHYFKIYGEKD